MNRRNFIKKFLFIIMFFLFKNNLYAKKLDVEYLKNFYIKDFDFKGYIPNNEVIDNLYKILSMYRYEEEIIKLIDNDHINNKFIIYDQYKISHTEINLIYISKIYFGKDATNDKENKNSIDKKIEILDYFPKKICQGKNGFIDEGNGKFGAFFKFKEKIDWAPKVLIDNLEFKSTINKLENLVTISLSKEEVDQITNKEKVYDIMFQFDDRVYSKTRLEIIDEDIHEDITWGLTNPSNDQIGFWMKYNCLDRNTYMLIDNQKISLDVTAEVSTVFLPISLIENKNIFKIYSNEKFIFEDEIFFVSNK